MHAHRITLGILTAATMTTAHAASLEIDRKISLSGGLTGGSQLIMNPGPSGRPLTTQLNDFIVEVSTEKKEDEPLTATLAVGSLNPISVGPTNSPNQGTPIPTGIQYGWFEYKQDNLSLSAGQLITRVGYESTIGYQNANITHGGLWGAQPSFYPGLRAESKLNNLDVYGELTNAGPANQAAAIGLRGEQDNLGFAFNYYNEKSGRDIIDIIVEIQQGDMKLGFNFDFIKLDNATPGADDDAFGLAFFTSLKLNEADLPIRIEYLSDGNSGIFGSDKALTLTATPTKWINKSAYVRGEFAFVSTDNKVFSDSDGKAEDSQVTVAVQAGLLF